jgi:hypothetical protein
MVITVMIRRAALFLLAVCLASSVAANTYPGIEKSQVVKLDVRTIENNANSSTPFALDLGETQVKVVLSPAPVWPKEGVTVIEVGKDGGVQQRIVQGNITYAGQVVGEDPEESEARLTRSGGVLDGYVSSVTGQWFIEPLTRFDPKAGPDQYLVYATRDLKFAVDYGDDGVKADQVTGWEPPHPPHRLVIPVVMVADKEYIDSNPADFIARQTSLINDVNGIYRHQIGRTFEIVAVVADFQNRILTTSNASDLKKQLKCVVHIGGGLGPCPPDVNGLQGLMNLNAFFAHLTTGKDLFGSSDLTYGIADQNGRFGLSQQSGAVRLRAQNKMIAAHEIGHNFGGIHCAADLVCRDGHCGYTIMNKTYSDSSQPWFSDALHPPTTPCPPNGLNNRKNIRDFMTELQFF